MNENLGNLRKISILMFYYGWKFFFCLKIFHFFAKKWNCEVQNMEIFFIVLNHESVGLLDKFYKCVKREIKCE